MRIHPPERRDDRSVERVSSRRGRAAARRRNAARSTARIQAGVAALLLTGSAGAADLPARMPSPAPAYDWSGFYVGGHLGFATATSAFTATQPAIAPNLSGTLDLFRPYDLFTGEGSNLGGFQAGYNTVFKSGLMIGVEADISFPGRISGTSTLATPSIGTATYEDLVEMSGSVRTRIGQGTRIRIAATMAAVTMAERRLTPRMATYT